MLKVMAVEQRQRETQRPEPGSQMPECILNQFHPFCIQFSAVSSFPSLGLPLKMGILEGKGPPRATQPVTQCL